MPKALIKKYKRFFSVMLLLVMSMHALSIHGFAESLIYCVEADGEVNIESNNALSIVYKSEADFHHSSQIDHKHSSADIHQTPDNHNDFSLSEICVKENRVNRFDQDKTVQKINNDLYRSVSILPTSANKQLTTFIPPIIEQQELVALETIVLLN